MKITFSEADVFQAKAQRALNEERHEEYSLGKVLESISGTMPCESCPYQCVAKGNSSRANCEMQWRKILSNLKDDVAEYNDRRFFKR